MVRAERVALHFERAPQLPESILAPTEAGERRSRAAKTPSLSAVRRSVTETVTAILFMSNEHFAKIVADLIRAPPRGH